MSFLFLQINSQSQQLDIDWSKRINYDRATTGEIESFVGANNKYVYALFTPALRLAKTQRYLIVFDKSTMLQVAKLSIHGSSDFREVRITDDAVFYMSADTKSGKEIVYAQTYTPTLEPIKTKTKIYERSIKRKFFSTNTNNVNTYVNRKANNQLYVIAENPGEKGEPISMDYVVFDSNLNEKFAGTASLPVERLLNTSDVSSRFSVGDDGMIITRNFVRMDRETRHEEKTKQNFYALLTIINPNSKNVNSIPVKATGKNIIDFEYFTKDGRLHVIGLYSENIGKRSERGSGIFEATMNAISGEFEDSKFTEIQAPSVLFSGLYVEKVKYHENGSITLYATEDRNYTVTSTTRSSNGTTSTTTKYYNSKGEILIVNLKKDMSLNWKQVINRSIIYNGWYIRDLASLSDETNTYVTYGDSKNKKGKRNIFTKSLKHTKEKTEVIYYSQMSLANGAVRSSQLNLNKSNTDKKDKKYANIGYTREFDDILYVDAFTPKVKTSTMVTACAIGIPTCGCGFYFYLLAKMRNGKAFEGGGSIGALKIR